MVKARVGRVGAIKTERWRRVELAGVGSRRSGGLSHAPAPGRGLWAGLAWGWR